MKKNFFYISGIIISLSMSACSKGQTMEATATIEASETSAPTATATLTPTMTPTPLGKSSGKILYTISNPEYDDNDDIAIIDIVTKETEYLTNINSKKTSYYNPAISPDGRRIAYVLAQETSATYYGQTVWKSEIFIMDIDGQNSMKITNIPLYRGDERIDDFVREYSPVWSPDGKKIAFTSNRDSLIKSGSHSDYEINVIDLETNEIQLLTKARGTSEQPSWSPDGSQIAFMSDRDGDWDIYIMNSDGTGKDVNLLKNTTSERWPSWSHDGRYLVYHSDREGNLQLYLYDFDNDEEIKLTNSPGSNFIGKWSPDDQWIVFGSDRDGDYEIFVINVNTKEEIKITDNNVTDSHQSWIP